MPRWSRVFSELRAVLESEPLLGISILAAAFAIASTPLAFAILGRMPWFQARRGRVLQRPSFSAVVCAMLLVMGLPSIFALLALKSRYFDRDRYEFDPNQTLSVLDRGGRYQTVKEIDEALRAKEARLNQLENDLLNEIKKLDEVMIALRAAALQHPATAQALPAVLDRLGNIHKLVKLDAPQQLLVLSGQPAALGTPPPTFAAVPPAPVATAPVASVPVTPAAPAAATGAGLDTATREAELATVPEAQRGLAAMLPLTELPPGWVLSPQGARHLETFTAENMFEKINGRAESFIQYNVTGMAYASYHPQGDDSSDVQVYIFEFTEPIKAFGKYGSEKPDEVEPVEVGAEGYSSAGSLFFYEGKYYTQVIATSDDPKFREFGLELARRIAKAQKPQGGDSASAAVAEVTPAMIFKLLPNGPGRGGDKFVAQDVFGYSFFTDVFLADYQEGEATWQGFVRPFESPEAARVVFEKYVEEVKGLGAEVQELEPPDGITRMVQASQFDLTDVLFLKGNAIAGANGATKPEAAQTFARSFAASLPEKVPVIASAAQPAAAGEGSEEP